MVSLEQVERLLQYADVSFEEARDALEASNGSLLDAIVRLERQGKIRSNGRAAGGAETPDGAVEVMPGIERERKQPESEQQQPDLGRRIGELFDRSIRVMFVAYNGTTGKEFLSMPALALIILVVFAFWVVLPLMLVGLICGLRYRFDSPEKDVNVGGVNKVMDDLGDAADSLKREAGFNSGTAADKKPRPPAADTTGVIDVEYTSVEPPKYRGPEQL